MDIGDQKTLALKQCIDIFKDYEEDEVKKFAPKSVQLAWEIGRDYFEYERKKDAESLKNFRL